MKRELQPDSTFMAQLFRLVWTNHVRRAYETSWINSERALQAAIVAGLAPIAPRVLTLVEPTVEPGGERPDLVVVDRDSHNVLAVVELKFLPHLYPPLGNDIEKLNNLLSGGFRASDIDPNTGKEDRSYASNDMTLGVAVAVGKFDAEAVKPAAMRERYSNLPAAGRILHAYGSVPHTSDRPLTFGCGWLDQGG